MSVLRVLREILLISIVLACLLSGAPARADENKPSTDALKIGAVLALTGPAQKWGQDALRSIEMAVEEINQRGGVGGRLLKLFAEDSGTEPLKGVSAFARLTRVENVQVVIGDVWSHLTIPLIPLADRARVVLISPSVVPASIEKPGEYFFTMGFKPEGATSALDRFFSANQQIKTVSIICWDDPWGDVYLKAWLSAMERHGVKLLGKLCNRDYAHEYRTDVAKVAAQKPDAVLFAYHAERILKNLKEQQFSPVVLTTNDILESLRNGTLPWSIAAGSWFTDWPPEAGFAGRFEKKHGEPPLADAFTAYDAVYAVMEAAGQSPGDLLAGLKSVKRTGLAGPLDFSKGFAANYAEPALFRVENDTTVRVK